MSQPPADHRRMGIYRHLSVEQLQAKRDKLMQALEARLTLPTSASGGGRSVQFNQDTTQIERQIQAIHEELDSRTGKRRGPIYLV
ncbi:hypothetical protein ACSLNH_01695 [Comamonas kerstersii]|uniref:hypothetical protein n=1 Tax=Comamonas kerstersii TaxID=225992 RepID=UPI003EE209D2